MVASGIKKAIKVKVHIIGQFIVQTRFVCQFNIEGRVTSVNAQLLGDTIYCDSMEFSYTSRAPNITATFAVIWGGSKPLDNPDNIHSKLCDSYAFDVFVLCDSLSFTFSRNISLSRHGRQLWYMPRPSGEIRLRLVSKFGQMRGERPVRKRLNGVAQQEPNLPES